MKIMRPAQRLH